MGKLDFEEKILIVDITTTVAFTTENIKGYWVKIKTKDDREGYVFNGF